MAYNKHVSGAEVPPACESLGDYRSEEPGSIAVTTERTTQPTNNPSHCRVQATLLTCVQEIHERSDQVYMDPGRLIQTSPLNKLYLKRRLSIQTVLCTYPSNK
jgi:hypothetical protein